MLDELHGDHGAKRTGDQEHQAMEDVGHTAGQPGRQHLDADVAVAQLIQRQGQGDHQRAHECRQLVRSGDRRLEGRPPQDDVQRGHHDHADEAQGREDREDVRHQPRRRHKSSCLLLHRLTPVGFDCRLRAGDVGGLRAVPWRVRGSAVAGRSSRFVSYSRSFIAAVTNSRTSVPGRPFAFISSTHWVRIGLSSSSNLALASGVGSMISLPCSST